MATLKLFWTKTALKQRNYTFAYWNKKNKSNLYSKRLLSLINKRTSTLLTFPKIGKKVNFNNTRAISLEHFSIFYRVELDKIIIISFWDNRRNPKELLQFLKKNHKT